MPRSPEFVTALLKRGQRLRQNQHTWLTRWEEMAEYVRPEKADHITERTPGDQSRVLRQYDSTAIHASQTLAASMHTALTSPSLEWFLIVMRQDELNSMDKVKEWLGECRKRMFKSLAESNFNSQINEAYLDLVDFGTAVLFSDEGLQRDEDWAGLNFRTYHLKDVAIAEGYDGVVDTIFRRFQLTAKQAIEKFPEADMPKVRAKYLTRPDHKFWFSHAVVPTRETDPDAEVDWGHDAVMPNKRPWQSFYVSESDNEIVEEQGYYEFPYLVPRWSKYPRDVWGHSPTFTALPDIRTINEAKRYEFRAWEKIIDPPFWATQNGIIGDLHLESGGVTYVRDQNAIGQLQERTDWNAAQIKSAELKQSIRDIYFYNQLQMPERPNATATEVQLRYELMQRLLAPQLGRLQSELLNPLVRRAFYMMLRAGQLPEIPEELMQVNADLDIEYSSPLARAQKSDETNAIVGWATQTGQLGQLYGPEMTDAIDPLQLSLALADSMGVPAKARRGEKEIEEQQAKRQQQQQQAMAAAQAQQAAQAGEGQARAANQLADAEQKQLQLVGG